MTGQNAVKNAILEQLVLVQATIRDIEPNSNTYAKIIELVEQDKLQDARTLLRSRKEELVGILAERQKLKDKSRKGFFSFFAKREKAIDIETEKWSVYAQELEKIKTILFIFAQISQ